MKVHAAAFLAPTTFCGRPLVWVREQEGEPRVPMLNGKPVIVTRRLDNLTCGACANCAA